MRPPKTPQLRLKTPQIRPRTKPRTHMRTHRRHHRQIFRDQWKITDFLNSASSKFLSVLELRLKSKFLSVIRYTPATGKSRPSATTRRICANHQAARSRPQGRVCRFRLRFGRTEAWGKSKGKSPFNSGAVSFFMVLFYRSPKTKPVRGLGFFSDGYFYILTRTAKSAKAQNMEVRFRDFDASVRSQYGPSR